MRLHAQLQSRLLVGAQLHAGLQLRRIYLQAEHAAQGLQAEAWCGGRVLLRLSQVLSSPAKQATLQL